VHLLGIAFEESATAYSHVSFCLPICDFCKLAANEKSVSGEDGFVVAVFEQKANAVLSVARGVQSLDLDVANVEGLAMGRCLCDFAAVFTTDYGERV
jgi:hypothetical protein